MIVKVRHAKHAQDSRLRFALVGWQIAVWLVAVALSFSL
jgi:hypothetical protein